MTITRERQSDYDRMLENYRNTMNGFVGPMKVMVCGDTFQVSDYSKYNWTMFNPETKKCVTRRSFLTA